jgi:hypothetical protein
LDAILKELHAALEEHARRLRKMVLVGVPVHPERHSLTDEVIDRCAICRKSIMLEQAKVTEDGRPVHGKCYAVKTSLPGFDRRCLLARPAALLASSLDFLQGTSEKIHFQRLLHPWRQGYQNMKPGFRNGRSQDRSLEYALTLRPNYRASLQCAFQRKHHNTKRGHF